MFKKLKAKIAQRNQLKKMQKYYKILQSGALFIDFIRKDLKEKKNAMNRHQRRRFEKTLMKGDLTPEIINHYSHRVDAILKSINAQLNPPKKKKEIDGKKFYDTLKKQEKKEKK